MPVAGLNVRPLGRLPDSINEEVGKPMDVTVNDAAIPSVNVPVFALVIEGTSFTASVKPCVTEANPLFAVKLML